jgi:hypothetical protein
VLSKVGHPACIQYKKDTSVTSPTPFISFYMAGLDSQCPAADSVILGLPCQLLSSSLMMRMIIVSWPPEDMADVGKLQ